MVFKGLKWKILAVFFDDNLVFIREYHALGTNIHEGICTL